MALAVEHKTMQQQAFSSVESTTDAPTDAEGGSDRDRASENLKPPKKPQIQYTKTTETRIPRPNRPKVRRKKVARTPGHPKAAAGLAWMPEVYRRNYRRAMSGKSPAAGIKSFCLECVGWHREEVKACTSPACSLYPYRPYQD